MMVRMHYRSFCTLNHSTLAPSKATASWRRSIQEFSMVKHMSSENDHLKYLNQPFESHFAFTCTISFPFRSQWPRGLRRRFAAARLLRSWVRITPGAWMFVRCQCCVLSGRGLRDELITRSEESYRLRCVVVCDLETSRMRRPWTALGRSSKGEKKIYPVVS